MAGAYAQVRALFHQVHDAVGQGDLDLDVRVAREELRQRRHQLVRAEGMAHVHAQPSLRPLAEARDFVLGLLDVREDALRAVEEGLALRGEREAARGAVQEPDAEAVLHARDELRDGRGRETEVARGRREPALLDRAHERGHVRGERHVDLFLNFINFVPEHGIV